MSNLDLNIDFNDEEHIEAEARRQKIRLLIEKMDLPQLEIMSAIAMSSVSEKNKEILAMLHPDKFKYRARKKRK